MVFLMILIQTDQVEPGIYPTSSECVTGSETQRQVQSAKSCDETGQL